MIVKEYIKKHRTIYNILRNCYLSMRYIFGSKRYKEVCKFLREHGNDLLEECPFLNQSSTVFELGGYKGEWVKDIYRKYQCECYVFEPVKEFCDIIEKEIGQIDKVHIYNMGIGILTHDAEMAVSEDGSSLYAKGSNKKVKIKALGEFLEENHIKKIDLMQINIEGGEYDILEWLIKSGCIMKVKNIQVQFHDKKGIDAEKRMENIQSGLGRTHACEWAFRPYVWERWSLRDAGVKKMFEK